MFQRIEIFMDCLVLFVYSCFYGVCTKSETKLFANGENMNINKPAESGCYNLRPRGFSRLQVSVVWQELSSG